MSQATVPNPLQELRNWRPNRDQVLRFGISMLLSILLWGWVTQLQDPFESRTLAGNSIEAGNLPGNLQIVTALPDARVTVSGSRSEVRDIRQSEIVVTVDTSGIARAGTYQVPLVVSGADASDVSVEPDEVSIQVDERISIVLPVRIEKTEATGELVTDSEVVPRVSQVTVSGPSSAVNRVHEVVLPIVIDAANENYDTSLTPVAVDSTGQPVSEVEILPGTVLAQVEVRRQGRSVSVIPNVTGAPADGYAVQQRRALPDTIVVDGPDELLANLLFVNTEAVDVSGATNSISTMVGISDLPEGVTIIEPATGMVEVRVAIEDATTSAQPVTDLPVDIRGLEAGLVGTVTPATLSIDVSAPADVLQLMTPADISVSVDVTGLEPGVYILSPEVSLPPGATWRASGADAARLRVVIEEEGEAGTPVVPITAATPSS
jgi:YbbR domain-containing protein